MNISWPDLAFPPINLWNAPYVMVHGNGGKKQRLARPRVAVARRPQTMDSMRRFLVDR